MDEFAEDLFRFIGDVARASTMQEIERRYLDGIGRFVRSSAAGIYVINPFTHGAESIAARGVSDFFLSRYEELGRHRDPVLERALRDLRATHSDALMTPEQWAAQPVYDQVFRLHRMVHLLEAPIVVDDATIGTLNFGRAADEGAFTEQERRLADAIARLLGTAFASLRARHSLVRERDQVLAALELCPDAVVVTDLRTAERRMNAAARRLLERLADGEDALEQLMVHPLRQGEPSRHEAGVRLRDGTPVVLAARSTSATGDETVVISFLELLAEGEPSHLLAAAQLTRRELQVAELAVGGLRDAEIAAQLFLSPYTVKQYLKAVYAKLGVRSRVELTRLMVVRPGERPPGAEP